MINSIRDPSESATSKGNFTMKAMHFAKPLEYRVELPGDEFIQGVTLEGSLSVTNRDKVAIKGLKLEIGLAYGDFKEMKDSGAGVLSILQRIELAKGINLKPQEEKRVEFQLPLAPTTPIQSKTGGPFLLYGGNIETPQTRGHVDLPIELSPSFAGFLSTLENHFAFETKASESLEGVIEARLKPPGSYPTLEELTVTFRPGSKDVEVEFYGKGRGLKRGADGGLTTKNTHTKMKVPNTQFSMSKNMPNRALYREMISDMLPEIAVRVEKKPGRGM